MRTFFVIVCTSTELSCTLTIRHIGSVNTGSDGSFLMKRTDKLGFKLGIAFLTIAVISLAAVGILTYFHQMNVYRQQCEKNVKSVGRYIESLIVADGVDFIQYVDYYLEHYREIEVPMDADEYESYEREFNSLFQEKYPGKTLGVDIDFKDMDEEAKKAYFIYSHIYWVLTFEWARSDFNLPYTYFLLPDENTETVMYIVDAERVSRAGHKEFTEENPQFAPMDQDEGNDDRYMYLGDTYVNSINDQYAVMWNTWTTGEEQDGFVVWDNEWGETYSYYVPVIINGRKLGLVVTEEEIADVNREILANTISQLGIIAVIFLIAFAVMLLFIKTKYVSRIEKLESFVMSYTSSRDGAIADQIDANIKGKDEIGSLAREVVSMIKEIQNHIKFLMLTNQELADTKGDVAKMSDLARKDALTGIRNRTAYEDEVEKLECERKGGNTEFGIVMIDLNFLKRTNDTYGHEKGNESIKKLCYIVCHIFEHSPVFRIGGDEFVAILSNDDFRNRDALVERFESTLKNLSSMEELQPWERISAAIGMAVYEEGRDTCVDDVFKRADSAMYECKTRMKAVRGN